MTGSGIEIKISCLQYVFTTRVLATFHYDSSGNFLVNARFQWQNEFLPTQDRLEQTLTGLCRLGVAAELTSKALGGPVASSRLLGRPIGCVALALDPEARKRPGIATSVVMRYVAP